MELLKVALDECLILLLEQYSSILANLKPDPKWLEILFQMLLNLEMCKALRSGNLLQCFYLFCKVFAKPRHLLLIGSSASSMQYGIKRS